MQRMHSFSWDGVSFNVPDDWDLSSYETNRSKSHIEMDDGVVLRLIAEWTRLPQRFNAPRIHRRYVKAVQRFKKRAMSSRDLFGLPRDWYATLYTMSDDNKVLAASYLAAEQRRFFSFLLYFYKDDPGKNRDIELKTLRSIAESVAIHSGPLTPWHCFDFAFELSSDFRLAETIFLSGRKQMVFEWRRRRLYVWLISLAEMVLNGRDANAWAAEFLNGIEGLRGPKFIAAKDGSVTYRRRALWPLGHADQIFRLCFRYKIHLEHYPERNQIFMWAYHYRRSEDVKKLEGLKFTPERVAPGP